MEKRRWSEHDARPALSIPGPQANAGHDRSLAFYLAAAETAIASEATSVLLVAQPKRLMFLGDKPGQRRFRPDRETIAPHRMRHPAGSRATPATTFLARPGPSSTLPKLGALPRFRASAALQPCRRPRGCGSRPAAACRHLAELRLTRRAAQAGHVRPKTRWQAQPPSQAAPIARSGEATCWAASAKEPPREQAPRFLIPMAFRI